jgi:hypothetical protein
VKRTTPEGPKDPWDELTRRYEATRNAQPDHEPAVVHDLAYERVVGKRGWLAMYEAMMAEATGEPAVEGAA